MARNLSQNVHNIIRQAILKRRMPLFKKLVSEDKAWALYINVIEKYIAKARAKKMAFDLSSAKPEDIENLKLLDREVRTLEWVIKIPQSTISKILVEEQEETEKKLVEEIKEEQKNE